MFFVVLIIFIICVGYYYHRLEKTKNKEEPFVCLTDFEKKVLGEGYVSINEPFTKPYIVDGLLTKLECNNIMDYVIDRLGFDPQRGGRPIQEKYNRQLWINKDEPIVKDIVERLAKRSRIPFENAENVLVLQYKPFRISVPTYDGCCDLTPRCDNFLKNGGQRVLAIEIYLNSTDFDDGATIFPNLNNFKLKPDIGGGNIIFPLADNINKCHPGSKRASERVTNGVKWTMNIWFREKKVE